MVKRLISFRINKDILEGIQGEADKRDTTLSAVIEERLNPLSEFKN
ncbi:MAG: hypothetical protein U9O94_00640 [Nanoarchaeota archaeon]|nr:hypothetical protein [Nanoarchaeota archaeon]